MRRSYLYTGLLAFLAVITTTHALPAPMSTEVATINPHHELATRFPDWPGKSWRLYTYHAEVYWKAGGCIALGCYNGGDVKASEGVGIATGILYGIAAFGKSFLPEDYRPWDKRQRGHSAEWDRFLDMMDDGGLNDELPSFIEFHDHERDQFTFHTKSADLDVSRLQVMHPVKRSMENLIRIRTRPQYGLKRQEGYYGIEAFFQEESDYGYPPDRGWVGETAEAIGNSISENQVEGDMCMKMVNFDGATSYSYIRYDGTPDNEEYDNVFGCDQAPYE